MFNFSQIQELLQAIEKMHVVFIGQQLGTDVLTTEDKRTLEQFGIDWNARYSRSGKMDEMFRLGMLAEALGQDTVRGMPYDKLKAHIASGKFLPLTTAERSALEAVKFQAYNDIKGLGNRVSKDFSQVFVDADTKLRAAYQNLIRDEAEQAILLRRTARELAQRLKAKTGDWSRDFDRIADYIMHSALDAGIAQQVLKTHGADAEVYKDVYPGACQQCIKAYLTAGIGSKPKIFKLRDIMANGSNVGRKQKDWLPVIGPHHPWSLTEGRTPVLTEQGWKAIRDIQVGDYVLTHKGRFRKVLSKIVDHLVPSDYPIKKRYRVEFELDSRGKSVDKYLSLTAEHKVLIMGKGWVEIQNVEKGDKLLKLKKPCINPDCSKSVDFSGGHEDRLACGDEVCDKYHRALTAKKLHEQEPKKYKDFKLKISERVRNNWKEGKHVNTLASIVSDQHREASRKMMLNDNQAIKRLKKASGTLTSKPQIKLFEKVLSLYPQAQLEYLTAEGKLLDIAIPDLKINVEYDGAYWHDMPKNQERDKKKDEFLRSIGWHVLRYRRVPSLKKLREDLAVVEGNSSGSYYFEECEIKNILIFDLVPGQTKLFDIEVEEDESFIARGVVIHNCRCTLQYKFEDTEWDDDNRDFKEVRNDRGVRRVSKPKIYVEF